MRRPLALAVLAAAAFAVPAGADAPEPPDTVECFRRYVTVADPVPRTPEEYVAAVVRDVNRTVTFGLCVAT